MEKLTFVTNSMIPITIAMRLVFALLTTLLFSNMVAQTPVRQITLDLTPLAFISKGTLSMDNVNAYFAEKYAFNFDEEHRKFISHIHPPRSKDASFRTQSSALYTQRVTRDDLFWEKPFAVVKGDLLVSDDSLIFNTSKTKYARFNFAVPYDQIRSIRPFYGFIIPNRIKVKLKNGEAYRLFTYKKKEIIKRTRQKMSENRS